MHYLTVENDTELDLGNLEESNPDAMREVETGSAWISNTINLCIYAIFWTISRVDNAPYGWPEDEVKLLVARLACKGKFSFSQQKQQRRAKQAWGYLITIRRR